MKLPGFDDIIDKGYFHGLIPREELPGFLKKEGDFLLRISEPCLGDPQCFILSVLKDGNVSKSIGMKHYVIRFENGKFHIGKRMFDNIPELIIGHREEYKFVNGVKRKPWELTHSQVKIREKLGEGAYGEVNKGFVAGKAVAIKQNHMNQLTKAQIKEIMSEARNMRRLQHPHISKLVGIAALEQPLLIVMELATNGSLDSYLKKHGSELDDKEKATMCQHVSWALIFLQEKAVLHRDLAARNLLYDHGNVKLSDFGKSQPGPSYKMDPHERLPIRWLSPESMKTLIYDYASEVWSFGICCWEIFENGTEPFPGKRVHEVNADLVAGHNFPQLSETVYTTVRDLINEHVLVDLNDRKDIHFVSEELEKYTQLEMPTSCSTSSKRIQQASALTV